jgi:hypothetical protein
MVRVKKHAYHVHILCEHVGDHIQIQHAQRGTTQMQERGERPNLVTFLETKTSNLPTQLCYINAETKPSNVTTQLYYANAGKGGGRPGASTFVKRQRQR